MELRCFTSRKKRGINFISFHLHIFSLERRMDCSICSAMPYILRPPRNTICGACYEGARSIITLTNKHDGEKGSDKTGGNTLVSSSTTTKGFANALKWVKEMKEMEDMLNEKISYLGGFAAAFKDQTHTDIQIKPGDNGPSVPAHKALLVWKWLQLPLPHYKSNTLRDCIQ